MTDKNVKAKQEETGLQERKPTASERFTVNVMQQFEAEAGSPVAFSEYERTLAQHLFLKIDATLKELERKRLESGDAGANRAPIVWQNVNMRKLALDAVHRVHLGLDALIPAHIYPIPYFNTKEKKYDVDLRVGYRGELYYRAKCAVDEPQDVRLELVYETDTFVPIMKSRSNGVESYEFTINNPFARGKVVGGFAYIAYADESKNKLILVSEDSFLKSQKAAKSKDFWTNYPVEMRYKTLVHRAVTYLEIDPMKVNAAALAAVDADEADAEIDRNANGAPLTLDETPEGVYQAPAQYVDGQFAEDPEQAVPADQAEPLSQPGF